MTRPLTFAPATSALEPPKCVRVTCPSCGAVRSPREQWTFRGRETHWGYTFLVWTRDDGKRFARWVG